MKILIGSKVNPDYVTNLLAVGEREGIDLEIICSDDPQTLKDEVKDTEIFVGWWSTFDPIFVTLGEKLRWLQTLTAGVDNFLLPEMIEREIILTSAKGIHGIPMSEHMMGMLLGYTRKLFTIRANQRKKKWERVRVEEIYGKTMVILGLGSIGKELARRAKAFGMRVIGVKRTYTEVEGVDQVYGNDEWLEAVSKGDVVVSILPYTQETYQLIDHKAFRKMKSDAIFMNFGRGDVVCEKALVEALENAEIRGALLDVYEEEPLASDSPLWEMEQVVISPHMAAMSSMYMYRAMEIVAENLGRYLRGEELRNRVDFEIGY